MEDADAKPCQLDNHTAAHSSASDVLWYSCVSCSEDDGKLCCQRAAAVPQNRRNQLVGLCRWRHAAQTGGVRRRYRAKGLTEKGPCELVFFNEQEQSDMTVLEYFQQQYKLQYVPLVQPDTCMLRWEVLAVCLQHCKLDAVLNLHPCIMAPPSAISERVTSLCIPGLRMYPSSDQATAS